MPRLILTSACMLILLLPAIPSRAETPRIYASALGGIAIPDAGLVDEIDQTGFLRLKQKAGLAVGARIAVWPTSRVGVEFEGAYLMSDAFLRYFVVDLAGTPPTADFQTRTYGAWTQVYSLNLQYAVIKPALEPLTIFVSAGAAFVTRGGYYYDDQASLESLSDIGLVVGEGLRYAIIPGLNFRTDIKGFLYSFDPTSAGYNWDSQSQFDFLLSAGLEYAFLP